jgi:hypothetical protein
MVRSPSSSTAVPSQARKRTTRARNRYDVRLSSAPGAMISLPSLPEVHPGWRWVSAAFVAGFAALLYFLLYAPTYKVDTARIDGLQRMSVKEVSDMLELEGESIFTVNPGLIEQRLEDRFPEFSAVSAGLELPASVSITVTERIPVLGWRQDGQLMLVDEDGTAFPQRVDAQGNAAPTGAIPVVEALSTPPFVEGALAQKPDLVDFETLQQEQEQVEEQILEARPFLKPEMVRQILDLAQRVPSGASLIYDGTHGFGWQDPGGWQVWIGGIEGIDNKLKVYSAIVARANSEGLGLQLVSVEYVHAPYYRAEQHEEEFE